MIKSNNLNYGDSNLNQDLTSETGFETGLQPKKYNLPDIRDFYSSKLCELDCFIQDLLTNQGVFFIAIPRKNGGYEYDPSPLTLKYFRLIPNFISVVNRLPPCYEYSEGINAFIDAFRSISYLTYGYDLTMTKLFRTQPNKTQLFWDAGVEIFNALVINIRDQWKTNKIQLKVNSRVFEANERYVDYCAYVDSLFDECARLVVLRIDLAYKKSHSNSKTASDIADDFDHFRANQRSNSIFNYLKGYIAKLEYGIEKGLHWHVILFFDGSQRNGASHAYLTQQIGDYWVNSITHNQGIYWNVNDNSDNYNALGRRGIGVIDWKQSDLRNNLKKYVIGYLCKVDQFIRPKFGPKIRLMRRGHAPETPNIKLGRPRTLVEGFIPQQLEIR
jgi:hypothetical protein